MAESLCPVFNIELSSRSVRDLGKEKGLKKRRKSGEILDWLNKRAEAEMENKEKGRRERQEEREILQQQLYLQQKQQQQQFSMLQQQMAMMHQQQQQTQAMFELLRQGTCRINIVLIQKHVEIC